MYNGTVIMLVIIQSRTCGLAKDINLGRKIMVGIHFKSLHYNGTQILNCLNTKYLLKVKQETIQK